MRSKLEYKQLDALHVLRGLCAIYVVVFHAKMLWSGGTAFVQRFPVSGWSAADFALFALDTLSSAGYEMVMFFFVLSGFFIRHAQLASPRSPLRFYANRAARIYPPYVASLVVSAAVLGYVATTHPQLLTATIGRDFNAGLLSAWNDLHGLSAAGAARTLAFLPPAGENFLGFNNAHWSLLPEALFYAIVPLAFWRLRWYLAASALAYGCCIAMPGPAAQLLRYGCYFALGVGLYEAVTTQPRWLAFFARVKGWRLAALATAVFVALVASVPQHHRQLSEALGALLAVLLVSTLLAGRVSPRNALVRALHRVGTFSYSLYLFHLPVLILCYAWLVDITGQLVNYQHYYLLAVPIATGASFALYWIVERQAVRLVRPRP